MLKKALSYFIIFIQSCYCFGLPPKPAIKQINRIAIIGGNIHIGNQKTLKNKVILIEEGLIKRIIDSSSYKIDSNDDVFYASKQEIYPGLILLNTILGLTDIDAVRATVDYGETGDYNASSRAIIAYNSENHIIGTVRSNGITLAQITPKSDKNFISGKSSVVQLDAWNWEDALIKNTDGVHLNWQTIYPEESANKEDIKKYNEGRLYNLQKLTSIINLAKKDTSNEELKTFRSLLNSKSTLYIHTNYAKDIVESYYYFKNIGIEKIVVIGCMGCESVIDFLKQNKIPVILDRLHSLPQLPEMTLKDIYSMPKKLSESGIIFSINYEGDMEAMGCRNLPFTAGTAVAYGLEYEKAIEMLTLNAAKILGLENKFGSIEVGKSATLVISQGDILDMKTNKITFELINGRKISLKNQQEELFERYKSK